MQAPLSKRCVLAVRAEDMAGTLDQQTSQVDVAGLRDAELRISIARLTASWSQAEIAPDISTLLEALFASQGQHERQSRQVANTGNLQRCLCLWILRLAELLDLTVVLLDLERHLGDLLEHRPERLPETWRHNCQAALGKTPCRRGWHPMAA